jgi:hypothetical protein
MSQISIERRSRNGRPSAAGELSRRMSGRAVDARDAEWEQVRGAFNLRVDQQPVAVALPRDGDDVAEVVAYASNNGLRIAAQSTGHNAEPLGSLEGTILLRTSQLRGVEIDAVARRVRVGAATRWREVVPDLSPLGFGALHGSSPDVGIAGYSLGGGMGWLARKHGLQTNSVTAIELVTAEGTFRRVDDEHEPELFWALRGGGGNFGVVTALEFSVHPLDELYAGALFFPIARAVEVIQTWNELLPSFPEELMTWANLIRFPNIAAVPEPFRGGEFVVMMAAFLGSEAEGQTLLGLLHRLGPAIDTFARSAPIALADLAMDPREPLPYITTHHLLGGLSTTAIEQIVAAAGPAGTDASHTLELVQLRHMGGALALPSAGAGARATLPGEISVLALGIAPDSASAARVARSLAKIDAAAEPGHVGVYPNFVEKAADASTLFDPPVWSKLRAIKTAYDPDDLFKGNHHIPALT